MVNFGSVSSCVVCDAADRGEILPDDVLEQLTAQSTPEGFLVPQFVFNEAKRQEEARKLDPMSPNVEDRLSTKFWFKAAGLKVAKGFKEIVTTALGSQKLAREKKRKRIFDRPIEDLVAKEMEEDK